MREVPREETLAFDVTGPAESAKRKTVADRHGAARYDVQDALRRY